MNIRTSERITMKCLSSLSKLVCQSMIQDMKDHHSEQLTAMRTPDNWVVLKPLHQVNNPILKKRTKLVPLANSRIA